MPEEPLFILGSGKAGTTFLADVLSQSPKVAISSPKEMWFFCTDNDLKKFGPDPLRDFCQPYRSRPDYLGEATPHYFFLPWVVRRISSVYPEAKFIVSLRHPEFRAYSHWKSLRNSGHENLDFREAIEKNWSRFQQRESFLKDLDRKEWRDFVSKYSRGFLPRRFYIEYGFYGSQLQTFLDYWDLDNLHIVCFDRLTRDSHIVFREIQQFLGTPIRFTPRAEKNPTYNSPRVHRLASALSGSGVDRFVPDSIVGSLKQILPKLGTSRESVEVLDEVEQEFRLEAKLLDELAGSDFHRRWFPEE